MKTVVVTSLIIVFLWVTTIGALHSNKMVYYVHMCIHLRIAQ